MGDKGNMHDDHSMHNANNYGDEVQKEVGGLYGNPNALKREASTAFFYFHFK